MSSRRKPVKSDHSELSPERLEQRIRNVLLFQLGKSAKTEHQLRELLRRREFPEQAFEPILERFVESQLIDDRAFATGYVASRVACGGRSRAALSRELRTRGVAQHLIDEALSEIDADAELQQATELAAARLRRMRDLDEVTARRRLLAYLQRRGYSMAISQQAMRRAGEVQSLSDVDTDL